MATRLHVPVMFFPITITLTLSDFFELDFLAGCNRKGAPLRLLVLTYPDKHKKLLEMDTLTPLNSLNELKKITLTLTLFNQAGPQAKLDKPRHENRL